jgi:hypothetical protein
VVALQHLVIDLDSDHLRFDLLTLEQVEDCSALNFLGFPVDEFSQVGIEIRDFVKLANACSACQGYGV